MNPESDIIMEIKKTRPQRLQVTKIHEEKFDKIKV